MKQLGVLVPIVTPCSKAGEPDLNGVKSVCGDFIEKECHGIFVCGSTGRGPWFSRSDQAKICRAASDQVGSKIPLFAGCTGMGLPEMLENSAAMSDAGASGVVLTSPGYFNYSVSELETIFLKFADKSPLPVMIYDIPVFAGSKLNTDMIKRLAQHENVIGFKDSSADFERFKKLASELSNLPDFYLIQGKEHLIGEAILNGASGLTVSLVHINPGLFVNLYNAAVSGNSELVSGLQNSVTGIMTLVVKCFERRPEISTLFHFLNHAMKKRGVCNNILLEHEGECPGWIGEAADEAINIDI